MTMYMQDRKFNLFLSGPLSTADPSTVNVSSEINLHVSRKEGSSPSRIWCSGRRLYDGSATSYAITNDIIPRFLDPET